MLVNYAAAMWRNLQRNGAYTVITVVGLTIGFAAAILIGLFVRHELTYDQFIPDHDRIYVLNETGVGPHGQPVDLDSTSDNLADEIKLNIPGVEKTARIATGLPPTLRRGQVNASERALFWADGDLFKILRVPTLAGDLGTALEAPDGLVLSRSAARKYFGQDTPLGGVVLVDGHPMRVNAVIEDLPSNSNLTGDVFASAKSPYSYITQMTGGGYLNQYVVTYVELQRGASAATANSALARFSGEVMAPIFQRLSATERLSPVLRLKPLSDVHLDPLAQGDTKPGIDVTVLASLGVIGALIVAVAAINFVTLMTARATRRALEVGVRKAMGAQRSDLVIQFMGEAMFYAGVALLLAVAIAELLLGPINLALQKHIVFDYLGDPVLDAVIIGIAAVTGVLAGVYPAIVLSSFRPASVLRGGPIANLGGGQVRLALVVAQFAVLIALGISAVTIFRQTAFAISTATHVDKTDVVIMFAPTCTDAMRDAMIAVPGVLSAGCASPAGEGLSSSSPPVSANGRHVTMNVAPIDFGFFETYKIAPVAGRLFSSDRPDDDGANHPTSPPPIIINASAVRALGFASPSAAIGQPVDWHYTPDFSINGLKSALATPTQSSQIIGVVPDFTFGSIRTVIPPTFYFVPAKTNFLASLALNVRVDPARLDQTLPAIDRAWRQVTGDLPEQRYFADQFTLRLYIDTLVLGGFVAICGLIAVVVACLGLLALSAFTAERRTKEIGVRKAMGASAADILRLLLWQFTLPVILASLIAWPIAFLAMRWWLQGFAYRIDQSPIVFVGAALVAACVGLATVFFQSYRAARTKPVTALRYE